MEHTFTVSCQLTINAPADAEPLYAYDGRMVGFQLADGSILKPWIVFEHQPNPDIDHYRDLHETDLDALGFSGFDYGNTDITEVQP